uniref:Uncharacterized protein n=1 Tax=Pipistrellus kuhlii TaxID=59472 RepID=A0A7J7U9Z6_PIPKU|nr:hypothetical protein mPipKuh1_009160 [Pipistrellus kuhlii]
MEIGRRGGGMEWAGLTPTCAFFLSGEISLLQRPPLGARGPQPRTPELGREVLLTSGCKNQWGRDRFGSVDRASACGLNGPGFDSGQGHVPSLWAHPRCGVCKRQPIDDSLSSMFLTLYPSLFLSVKNQ